MLTKLLAALMLAPSIPDVISMADEVKMVTEHLGYPAYFIPFIGIAKLLGVIAILILVILELRSGLMRAFHMI
ncbi:MAG: DoxX family protein [Chitinophagales bacterium]|nr:DoxX family protein [Chitinophagales bacterium]